MIGVSLEQDSKPTRDRRVLNAVLKASESAREAKDYKSVVALLEPIHLDFPNELLLAEALADAYAELGRNEEAEREFRRAIAIDPNNCVSHYNFGCFLQEIGRVEEARRAFQEAVALNPGHANAWTNLAGLSNDPLEAIQYLEQARASGSRDKEVDVALEMWRDFARNGADMGMQRLLWAEQACLMKDIKPARRNLALARQLNLDGHLDALGHKIESDILRHQGDLAGSVEQLQKAIEVDPEPPIYWNTLSARESLLADQRMGTKDAIVLRRRALEHALAAIQRGDYAKPYRNAAVACLALGQRKEARRHAAKAREMANRELVGNHVCVDCPTGLYPEEVLAQLFQKRNWRELECRNCLQDVEAILRNIL